MIQGGARGHAKGIKLRYKGGKHKRKGKNIWEGGRMVRLTPEHIPKRGKQGMS